MTRHHPAILTVIALLVSASISPAQSTGGATRRWSVSYATGFSTASAATRDLENSLAAARFNWTTAISGSGGCYIFFCTVPYSGQLGLSKSSSAGRSRKLTVGYALSPHRELRAEAASGNTGWAEGQRGGYVIARFDHRVSTFNVQGLLHGGRFRIGLGPELTRATVKSRISHIDAYRPLGTPGPDQSQASSFIRLGAVTSASLTYGGRVFGEFGVQCHLAPSVKPAAITVHGQSPDATTTIGPSSISLNRYVLTFGAGIRP